MAFFKNVVFDLGGVIIDLAVENTINEFSKLTGHTSSQIWEAYRGHGEFIQYEKGLISDEEFRQALRKIFSIEATSGELDRSWNAMLVGLPKHKLSLLENLKSEYTVAVLSNTNNIHLQFVDSVLLPGINEHRPLNHFFHHHYYSHQVRKRKPEPEIFHQVLEENKFNPAETVFLDDNEENIMVASALGIQTQLIKHPDQVMDYFNAL
jgi:putative hydrolase of the HAD superfamily